MRKPIVRKTNETTSTFQMYGYFLTEKAKARLRTRGLKTTDKTWAQVFNNSDVIYRYNPEKNKADVFVGEITNVKYASGKKISLQYPYSVTEDLNMIQNEVGQLVSSATYFTVNSNKVERGHTL